jgi:hypothetical protein
MPMRSAGCLRTALLAASLSTVLAAGAHAQDRSGSGDADPLLVTPAFSPDEWLAAGARLELRLSREPEPGAGRLAVFIGNRDVSDLFHRSRDVLVYDARTLPLPSGESELRVYQVTASHAWTELARIPVRVLTPAGLEKADVKPKLDVSNSGQLVERRFPRPEAGAALRDTYQDVTLNTGLRTIHVRRGLSVQAQANALGVTNREQALRFAERADAAPRYDLADYLVEVGLGSAELAFGHVGFGRQQHLVNGFRGRGVSSSLRIGRHMDLSLAAMNGTAIVGWSNLLGLSHNDHRVLGGSLALELVPTRPGMLRVEGSVMDGARRPLAAFNQGAITDSETSQGVGVHVQASDPTGRVGMEAGFARSRYHNPHDPLLSGGAVHVVPVHETTRNAQFLNTHADLLRGVTVGPTRAQLRVGWRHERIDPLFSSVAAHAQPDRLSNDLEVTGALGQLTVRAGRRWANDNLDNLPSVLKTFTRAYDVNAALPMASLLRSAGAWWVPMASYGYQLTWQFGRDLPVDGGFEPGHVPDQISRNHSAGLQWQGGRWGLGYRINYSEQDNRQPGRDAADFSSRSEAVSVSLQPMVALSISVEGGLDRSHNKEFDHVGRNRNIGLGLNWRPAAQTAFSSYASRAWGADRGSGSKQELRQLRAELSQSLPWLTVTRDAGPARAFVRWSWQDHDTSMLPEFGDFNDRRRNWNVNTGFSMSFF